MLLLSSLRHPATQQLSYLACAPRLRAAQFSFVELFARGYLPGSALAGLTLSFGL